MSLLRSLYWDARVAPRIYRDFGAIGIFRMVHGTFKEAARSREMDRICRDMLKRLHRNADAEIHSLVNLFTDTEHRAAMKEVLSFDLPFNELCARAMHLKINMDSMYIGQYDLMDRACSFYTPLFCKTLTESQMSILHIYRLETTDDEFGAIYIPIIDHAKIGYYGEGPRFTLFRLEVEMIFARHKDDLTPAVV